MEHGDDWIPFYGGKNPEMFAIERRCMDRRGAVIAWLDRWLPAGRVLDIGAGNGFTAARLTRPDRVVTALEPDPDMVDPAAPVPWVRGTAQHLPLHDRTFDGAYATWAFFFSSQHDLDQGIAEARRVVRPGGRLAFVDNAGSDAFSSLTERPIGSDAAVWRDRGFDCAIVETSFEFDSVEEARRLLGFYFGEAGAAWSSTEIGYRVAVYHAEVPR